MGRGMKVLRRDDYEESGLMVGLKLVGDIPKNCNIPTEWKCVRCGKVVHKRLSNIRSGGGCKFCKNREKIKQESYEELASQIGWKFVGPMPKTTMHKTKWIDEFGVERSMTYNQMNSTKRRRTERSEIAQIIRGKDIDFGNGDTAAVVDNVANDELGPPVGVGACHSTSGSSIRIDLLFGKIRS